MWSEKLIKLSYKLMQQSGVSVKSLNGKFGILEIKNNPTIYTLTIYDTQEKISFESIEEMIKAGWAVD
jgi:hypothetical protein